MTYEIIEICGSTHNHIGPYQSFDAARDDAEKRLAHGKMTTAYIVPRDRTIDRSNAIYRIDKNECDGIVTYTHYLIKPEHFVREVKRGMFGTAPGQGVHGYGSKISTDYMIRFNKRTYRVYNMCYSNVDSLYINSLYIKMGKQKVFVNEWELGE